MTDQNTRAPDDRTHRGANPEDQSRRHRPTPRDEVSVSGVVTVPGSGTSDESSGADRAQSITLSYTLGLGIGLILVTGLLIAGGDFVNDQRERAIRTELKAIGQQLSADIATADRLTQSADVERVTLRRSIPQNVAGSRYTVEIVAQKDAFLRLTSENPEVVVEVDVTNQTALNQSSVGGGDLLINYSDGEILLESRGDG